MTRNGRNENSLLVRFIQFVTFVNQPLKRRFTLFFLGVLWWFVVMTLIALGALILVENSVTEVNQRIHPLEESMNDLSSTLDQLQLCLSGTGKAVGADDRTHLLLRTRQLMSELGENRWWWMPCFAGCLMKMKDLLNPRSKDWS